MYVQRLALFNSLDAEENVKDICLNYTESVYNNDEDI